jgi:signal transduction histidine kinase/CheY-like chemotaxis protein
MRKDGSTFPLRLSVSEVTFGNRRIYAGLIHDLSHESELEKRLFQAQKMEALGTFAGGIAHDFNNILHIISGYCKLAQANINGNSELLAESLDQIRLGGQRASDLVSQILTFSRTTKVELQPIDLPSVTEEILNFIRSTIPKEVRVESNFDTPLGHVLADSTQIHQIVVNLCTNAVHAMEDHGGRLTVALKRVMLRAPQSSLSNTLDPGEYVALTVSDTGTGVDAEALDKLIDPFFTTKVAGKGTGLGLAMVHGISKSMNAGLSIESELGRGTTVTLMFPIAREAPTPTKTKISAVSTNGAKTVLLVDDEESMTRLAAAMLENYGFVVETLNDPEAVNETIQNILHPIDVAIFDYAMPSKTGLELARDIYITTPDIPVLIMSGLPNMSHLDSSESPNIKEFLKKPFNADDLIEAIERIL